MLSDAKSIKISDSSMQQEVRFISKILPITFIFRPSLVRADLRPSTKGDFE